jgi:RNAse (barnase) inhibitor barstar
MKEILISLASILFGWVLAELTYFTKEKVKARRLKKALLEEIKDCFGYLQRAKLCLEECIQLAYFKKLSDSIPTKCPTQIFKRYFTDIYVYLKQAERVSFNSIYQLLEVIHAQYDKIEALYPACQKDLTKLSDMNSLIEATYSNILNTLTIIRFHLDNSKKLDLNFWDETRSQQFQNEINKKIIALLDEAKEEGLEKIIRKYNIK